METIIISLALLFFLGHALNWVFIKTKVPDLLILVGLGYLIGPVFGWVHPHDIGKVGGVLATTALIVILYEGGLHLRAADLISSSLPAAGLSLMGFTLIAAFSATIAWALGGQSWSLSILLGIGLGSTSSAIVIPMVKPLSISDKAKTILSLESAFTDVLTIVMFLVLVDSMTSGVFNPNTLVIGLGPKTIQAGLLGLLSGTIWAFVKKRFTPIVSMPFSGEAWALLTYGVIETAGFNGAIGVLALGFILANLSLLPEWLKKFVSKQPVTIREQTLLSGITFLLRTFFFIYLGTLISFADFHTVLIAIILALGIVVTRWLTVSFLFPGEKYSRLDAMVATAMGPRGLACAVLATIPAAKGIPGGEWLQKIMFALIPLSILLTAIFVSLSEKKAFRDKLQKLFSKYSESLVKSKEPSSGLPLEPAPPQ
ncbi:MAG: cation:proton antiporter [Bdellovibrionales bacterium]|nr:cation:proton antiporter [Bdellovibrionales bacterium]